MERERLLTAVLLITAAQLVSQCKTVEVEVSTDGQGCRERRDRAKGGTHLL